MTPEETIDQAPPPLLTRRPPRTSERRYGEWPPGHRQLTLYQEEQQSVEESTKTSPEDKARRVRVPWFPTYREVRGLLAV